MTKREHINYWLITAAHDLLENPEIDYECKAMKLCTKEFTHQQFNKVKELYRYLISSLQSAYEPSS